MGSVSLPTKPSVPVSDYGLSEYSVAGFARDTRRSDNSATSVVTSMSVSAQQTLSPGGQIQCSFGQVAATNSGPHDVGMNDVYMSDEDAETSVRRSAETSVRRSANPARSPADSVFGRKIPSLMSMECSPAKSTPCKPVSVISNVPSMVPDGTPVGVPRFTPPIQQRPPAPAASNFAPSYSMSAAGSVPLLVSGGAAVGPPGFLPPVGQQLSGMPVPLPGGDLAQMELILQENPQLTQQVTALIVQQYPLYAGNPVGLRFAVCNELRLLKKFRDEQARPEVPPSSSVHISSTSVSDPDGIVKSESGSSYVGTDSTTSVGRSSTASSSLAGRNVDSRVKRSARAASTTTASSSTAAWSGSVPRTILSDNRNHRRARTLVNSASARLAQNTADTLDTFAEITSPKTGKLAVFSF